MLLGMCDPFSLLLCNEKCQHDEVMRVSYGVVYCCFALSNLRNLQKVEKLERKLGDCCNLGQIMWLADAGAS